LDGIYPKGFLVGVVSRLDKKGYGLFQAVEVTLAASPSRIEEIQVIFPVDSGRDEKQDEARGD
jgi:cell shape-determining protein MreC